MARQHTMNTKTQYFWVRFYPTAEWQLVKFYTKNEKRYLKGLDWMSEHELEKFGNKDYEVGHEIYPPAT